MSEHSHFLNMRWAATCFALVAGCAPPASVGERAASDDVPVPLCTFDVQAPERTSGALEHAQTGLDCVPPEYGAQLAVGFAYDGWRLVIELPRDGHRAGDRFSLDAGEASLLLQTVRGACTTWTGAVVWERDLPDWSVAVDATCSDGSARVAGRWSRD